jgi:outer membrane protein TolC
LNALALALLLVAGAEPRGRPTRTAPPPAAPAPTQEAADLWLSSAVGRPGGLTADAVATRAVESSPLVKQRNEEVSAAQAATGQAIVGWFPRASAQARYARLSQVDPQTLGVVVVAPLSAEGPLAPGSVLVNAPVTIESVPDQTIFEARLLVPLTDYVLKLPASTIAAGAAKDAAALQAKASSLSVGLEARLAYFNWARARLTAIVADHALTQAKAHRTSADKVFEAGGASKADLLRVDAQVAQAEQFLARVRAQESVLGEQLRVLMHQLESADFEIGEDLNAEPPASTLQPTSTLVNRGKEQRLEVKALQKTLDALGGQAWAARAGYLPRIDGFFGAQYSNPNPRYFPPKAEYNGSWDLGVQASWSPNEVAFSALATEGIEARRRAVERQREQFFDALQMEVVQAVEALREARLSVESTRRGLAAAEESYRVRKELFQNERSTSTEMTDAEQQLTQARLNTIAARIDERMALARLEHATGEDTK